VRGTHQRCLEAKNYDAIKKLSSWQMISARDGAMTIYHFGKVMIGIKSSIKHCPTINNSVDRAKLKSSGRLFNALFPKHEAVRHAVAHSGELANTSEAVSQNAFTGRYEGPGLTIENASNTMVQDSLQGRLFTTTHEGKILTYEIGQVTLIRLNAVKNELYDAFGPVP
jgi:hypothetical protein